MKIQAPRAVLLAACAVGLSACDGNSNSQTMGGGMNQTPTPDLTFTTFVKSLLASTSPDVAAPVDINARELTFDESATAYNDVLGN